MRRTKPRSIDRQAEKRAVVRSTLLNTLLRVCLAGLLLFSWSQRQPGLLKSVLLVLAVVNLVTIPFNFVVLRQRVREIEKGELEEAKKY